MKKKNLRFKKVMLMSDMMKLARKDAIISGRGDDLVAVKVELRTFAGGRTVKEFVIQFAGTENCASGRGDSFEAALKNVMKDAIKLANNPYL